MSVNPREQVVARRPRTTRASQPTESGRLVNPYAPDAARYGYASAFGWAGGFALVVIGIMFLLQTIGEPTAIRNIWALALAIPVAITAATAWMLYKQADKTLTRAAAGALTGSFVLLAVGVILALGLAWQHMWPLLLIAIGMSLLVQAMVPLRDANP